MFMYPQWTIHTSDWRWWLPFVGIVVVTALLWRGRNRPWVRSILFAWAFYLLALLPALGFTDVSFMQYSLVADHYQHLALVAVVARLPRRSFNLDGPCTPQKPADGSSAPLRSRRWEF